MIIKAFPQAATLSLWHHNCFFSSARMQVSIFFISSPAANQPAFWLKKEALPKRSH
jgi:hypothetical protein